MQIKVYAAAVCNVHCQCVLVEAVNIKGLASVNKLNQKVFFNNIALKGVIGALGLLAAAKREAHSA